MAVALCAICKTRHTQFRNRACTTDSNPNPNPYLNPYPNPNFTPILAKSRRAFCTQFARNRCSWNECFFSWNAKSISRFRTLSGTPQCGRRVWEAVLRAGRYGGCWAVSGEWTVVESLQREPALRSLQPYQLHTVPASSSTDCSQQG